MATANDRATYGLITELIESHLPTSGSSTASLALAIIVLPERRTEMAPSFDEYQLRLARIGERAARQKARDEASATEKADSASRQADRRAEALKAANAFAQDVRRKATDLTLALKESRIALDVGERAHRDGDPAEAVLTIFVRLYRDGRDTEQRLEFEVDEDRQARQRLPRGRYKGPRPLAEIDIDAELLSFIETCSGLPD